MVRRIWALSDLHLALGIPKKDMRIFGPQWEHHDEKIAANWRRCVAAGDLVLIAGDISWASHLQSAAIDLAWIDRLPGTKLLLQGNHDHWWTSLRKMQSLYRSLHFIHRNAFMFHGVAIGGARLWPTAEYGFSDPATPVSSQDTLSREQNEKIFRRDLAKLRHSLSCFHPQASLRIAMTHYPPFGEAMESTSVTRLLEERGVDIAVFGHLHLPAERLPRFGKVRGVQYVLTSCDHLHFSPYLLHELPPAAA